jgi:DNA polymerase-3 subunit delta'
MTMVGHDDAWKTWRNGIASGRLHHGWILAGREGLGKAGFARAAAAEWVNEAGTKQPAPENHPDILFLAPLAASDDDARKQAEGKPFAVKRNISVDQVRLMQRRLITRPTLGARRTVIIDSADDLEKGAVNALLKSLEEPPQGTVFLLVAHRPGQLLATIRSRCQIMRFAPLDASELALALDETLATADPATRASLIQLAAGSPGAAMSFADLNLGKAAALFTTLIEQGDGDLSLRSELSSALGQRPGREAQLAAIEAARRLLVTRLPLASPPERLCIAEVHQRLVQLGAKAPTYNFDSGLLLMEIGGLLASVGASREGIH